MGSMPEKSGAPGNFDMPGKGGMRGKGGMPGKSDDFSGKPSVWVGR